MISARIEYLLESTVNNRLIAPKGRDRTGVTRNLANMIDLSHRLGILHPTHANDLHALRRIRNKAAHFDEPMSLEDCLEDVKRFSRFWVDGRASAQFRLRVKAEQDVGAGYARARFLVAAGTFFVFFRPLATGVSRIERLPWFQSIDRT